MKNLRVLHVDDNESFSFLLRGFLEDYGVEVVAHARNGIQAITYAGLYNPDLILLDISMPGMNGIEIAKCLKTTHPFTRIVFLSLHDEEVYRDLVNTLHLDGFVSKNEVIDQLPETLNRVSAGLRYAMSA